MSDPDELVRLDALRQSGALSPMSSMLKRRSSSAQSLSRLGPASLSPTASELLRRRIVAGLGRKARLTGVLPGSPGALNAE